MTVLYLPARPPRAPPFPLRCNQLTLATFYTGRDCYTYHPPHRLIRCFAAGLACNAPTKCCCREEHVANDDLGATDGTKAFTPPVAAQPNNAQLDTALMGVLRHLLW